MTNFIKEGRLKFFYLNKKKKISENLKKNIFDFFDRIIIFFINCIIGYVFNFKIKSGFAILKICYQISHFCSPVIKSYFEKFSFFFVKNFLDFLKEIFEKKKILKIFGILQNFEYKENLVDNKLIYYYNDIINQKVDYIKKNREKKNLIKKNKNL